MSPELLEAFKAKVASMTAGDNFHWELVDEPTKCRLHWSKTGVTVISGDGVDVRLSLSVVERIVHELAIISLLALESVDKPHEVAERPTESDEVSP